MIEFILATFIFATGWLLGTFHAIQYLKLNPHKIPKVKEHTPQSQE